MAVDRIQSATTLPVEPSSVDPSASSVAIPRAPRGMAETRLPATKRATSRRRPRRVSAPRRWMAHAAITTARALMSTIGTDAALSGPYAGAAAMPPTTRAGHSPMPPSSRPASPMPPGTEMPATPLPGLDVSADKPSAAPNAAPSSTSLTHHAGQPQAGVRG